MPDSVDRAGEEQKQVEAVFRLVDGSTFYAVQSRWITGWITDEGPEMVRVRGWFESELPDPWIDPPEPKRLCLQGTAIIWWQEDDQVGNVPFSPSKAEAPDAS